MLPQEEFDRLAENEQLTVTEIAGRRTQGVTPCGVFESNKMNESPVVSVAHLSEVNGEGEEEETEDPAETSGSGEEATETPGGEEE